MKVVILALLASVAFAATSAAGSTITNPCAVALCGWGAECQVKDNKAVCVCPTVCITIADQRCGTDGVTYGNPCMLAIATCNSHGNITEAYEGPCVDASCAAVSCLTGTTCTIVKGHPVCCPEVCSQDWDPRCGSDGKTYSNECTMHKAKCLSGGLITQVGLGECPDPCALVRCGFNSTGCEVVGGQATCVCNEVCTDHYEPVCGTDGHTYGNACELEIAYCKSRGAVTLFREGECEGLFCGGIAAFPCPKGFNCRYDGNYPDAGGYCTSKRLVGQPCGGWDRAECATGLYCRGWGGSKILMDTTLLAGTVFPTGRCYDPTTVRACSVSQWTASLNNYKQWPLDARRKFIDVFPGTSVIGTIKQKMLLQPISVVAKFYREAIAAMLNAVSDFNYPLTVAQVVAKVQSGFASHTAMSTVTNELKALNDAGNCPL